MPTYYSQINMLVPPTQADHLARLSDVSGLYSSHFKLPVRAASTANLAASYDPGAKTLTASANGGLVVDGVALYADDRVLVAGQTAGTQNGIYVVTSPGGLSAQWAMVRSPDFDETAKIYSAVKVTAASGTVYDNRTFILATDAPITLDSTALDFVEDASSGGGGGGSLAQFIGSLQYGDPAAKTINHGLNTKNVSVDIFRDADGASVIADVTRPTVNSVTVTFAAAPTEAFTVLVRAA
jgi:hypothetical protein